MHSWPGMWPHERVLHYRYGKKEEGAPVNELFHVAHAESLPAVLERGLLPRSKHEGRRVWPGALVHEDAVYLFTSEAVARAYHGGAAKQLVLLSVDAGLLDLELATMDHEDLAALVTTQWMQYRDRLSEDARRELGSLAWAVRGDSKHERDQYVLGAMQQLSPALKRELLVLSCDADPAVKRWGRAVYFGSVPASALTVIESPSSA